MESVFPNQGMRKIKVLMISTSYPKNLKDWRGLFIRHLADAIARNSDTNLRLWCPPGEVHPEARLDLLENERNWLEWLSENGGIAHLVRSHSLQSVLAPIMLLRLLRRAYTRNQDCDVYHINWLQNALALPDNNKPLLLTALGTDMKLLRVPLVRGALRRKLKRHRSVICPNAAWMLQPLRKAFSDIAEIEHVPFGIDPCWYEINRPEDAPATFRWLAVTRITRAKIGPLFDWGERWFRKPGRELHLFGPMQESFEIPSWVHYHGPVSPHTLCDLWFPRAAGLISLSRHDEGLPQVMLEAMASKLPIIASTGVAAHEELLSNQTTGRLCDGAEQLGRILDELEIWPDNRHIGEAARVRAAESVGTWDDCAGRYIRLYKYLTAGNRT